MNIGFRQLSCRQSALCKDIRANTKSQVFTFLTVCLAASALFTPTQSAVAAATNGTQHLICIKSGEHLICDEANTKNPNQELASNNSIAQPFNSTQQDFLAKNLLWLSYMLPGSLILVMFLHESYAGYRSAVLSEQIQALERVWKNDPRS